MSRKLFALVTGAVLVGAWAGAGPVLADGPVVVEACGTEGCCRHARCPHDGVCVPTTETKKIEKRVYSDTCEQFCLPKCPLFGFFGGYGCGGCGHDCDHDGSCHEGGACHQCEHIRTRKYLVVKIKKEEQCVPACKVEQGACHEACEAPAGTIQPAPAKPMPATKPTAAAPQPQQVQALEFRYMPMPQTRQLPGPGH